jgi:hypothetical protein
MADERFFQFVLTVFILEVEELQQVRIADLVLDGDGVFGLRDLPFGQHLGFTIRASCPLIELGADLPVELAHRPATADGFRLVKRPGLWVVHGQEPDVMGPGEGEKVENGSARQTGQMKV